MTYSQQKTAAIILAAILAGLAIIQAANAADFGLGPIAMRWLGVLSGVGPPNGCCEGPLNRPSVILQSVLERGVWEAEFIRPVHKDHGPPPIFQADYRAGITSLFTTSRPAAIFRRVPEGVVDAVNSVLRRWFRPHISVEVIERLPSLTDRDTSPSIVGPLLEVGVGTALNHAQPCCEFRCVSSSVRGELSTSDIAAQTTARPCLSSLQSRSAESTDAAAVALAKPPGPIRTGGVRRLANDNQSAKALTGLELDKITLHRVPPVPCVVPRPAQTGAGILRVNCTMYQIAEAA